MAVVRAATASRRPTARHAFHDCWCQWQCPFQQQRPFWQEGQHRQRLVTVSMAHPENSAVQLHDPDVKGVAEPAEAGPRPAETSGQRTGTVPTPPAQPHTRYEVGTCLLRVLYCHSVTTNCIPAEGNFGCNMRVTHPSGVDGQRMLSLTRWPNPQLAMIRAGVPILWEVVGEYVACVCDNHAQ